MYLAKEDKKNGQVLHPCHRMYKGKQIQLVKRDKAMPRLTRT